MKTTMYPFVSHYIQFSQPVCRAQEFNVWLMYLFIIVLDDNGNEKIAVLSFGWVHIRPN